METLKKIFLIPCKSFSGIRQNYLHFGGFSSGNFRGISTLMNWRICRLIFGIFRLFPLILKGFIIEQETWEKIKQKCQLITKKLCTYSRTQPLGTEVKVGGHLYSSLCTLSLGIVLFFCFFGFGDLTKRFSPIGLNPIWQIFSSFDVNIQYSKIHSLLGKCQMA